MKNRPWHRLKRPEYRETLETAHLRLAPQTWLGGLQLELKLGKDRAARELMYGKSYSPSTWRIFRRYLLQHRGPNGCSRHTHAIINKADDALIGYHQIGLHSHRKASLTIVMLRRDESVRGFAKEARTALLRHFVTIVGVEIFVGEVDTRNFASVQLYSQLGFQRAGVLHNMGYDPQSTRVRDSFVFELRGEALQTFMRASDPRAVGERQ